MNDDDDRLQPVTRLGPDSGGRAPGESDVKVYRWEWGPDEARRPGLPWIGIFLLVFGGLLLLQQAFPQFKEAGSVLGLAVGLAFLVKWAIDRGMASLYAGAIITALAMPGVLNAIGIHADGLTTFSLGVAFLFIAAVRAATGGGIGWQFLLGGLLLIVGGVNIAFANLGDYLVPLVLLGLGAIILVRGAADRRTG
jgi:hypothetical protein